MEISQESTGLKDLTSIKNLLVTKLNEHNGHAILILLDKEDEQTAVMATSKHVSLLLRSLDTLSNIVENLYTDVDGKIINKDNQH